MTTSPTATGPADLLTQPARDYLAAQLLDVRAVARLLYFPSFDVAHYNVKVVDGGLFSHVTVRWLNGLIPSSIEWVGLWS